MSTAPRAIAQAKSFLIQGDAQAALNVLEAHAAEDYRGLYAACPEFYEVLAVCERALGRDARNAESQIEEMRLDWVTALKKGQQLLEAGRAKESIAYFERSLQANPGEAGTASGWDAAREGIKAAKALLKRQ